jgi:N-acetylmuramoyl-L-alanine amidase
MRSINEIIIHCTATPEGREVSIAEIDSWHRQRGFKGIGYHYVIHLDGRLSNGRSVEMIGAHCLNHNSRSIGVCYVGGTDRQGRAKDTRTEAQRRALLKLCQELKQKYPKATIHGHNEFAAKACPSFDVQAWRKEVGL